MSDYKTKYLQQKRKYITLKKMKKIRMQKGGLLPRADLLAKISIIAGLITNLPIGRELTPESIRIEKKNIETLDATPDVLLTLWGDPLKDEEI